MTMPIRGEEGARLKRQGAEQAIALALQSKWEEAVTVNRSLLSMFPSDVDAWNRLGKALLELGHYGEAREAYGKSQALDPVNNIAKRNLERLTALGDAVEPRRPEAVAKVAADLFIEEIGKTGTTSIAKVEADLVARMTAGDEVYLKEQDNLLKVENAQGEAIGSIEAKLGLRLRRLMKGGNRYAAAIKGLGDHEVHLIIKEIYQDPKQAGKPSFPSTGGGEGVRAYTKETLLRYEDEDDDEAEEESETDDWESDAEPAEGDDTITSLSEVIAHDDMEDEED